jgi:hypothetical protein
VLGDRYQVVADQRVDDPGHYGVALGIGIEEGGTILNKPDQGVEGSFVAWRVLGQPPQLRPVVAPFGKCRDVSEYVHPIELGLARLPLRLGRGPIGGLDREIVCLLDRSEPLAHAGPDTDGQYDRRRQRDPLQLGPKHGHDHTFRQG